MVLLLLNAQAIRVRDVNRKRCWLDLLEKHGNSGYSLESDASDTGQSLTIVAMLLQLTQAGVVVLLQVFDVDTEGFDLVVKSYAVQSERFGGLRDIEVMND